ISRWADNKRHPNGPMPAVSKSFEIISTATVAKSANEAKEYGFIGHDDGVSMNRDRLLFDAKQRALAMVDGYEAPEKPEYRLPGPTGKAALELAVDSFHRQGMATDHDVTVAGELAYVLSGGETDITQVLTEADMLKLEREAFMRLVRNPKTQARVEHMLETGKPLRN
ncbi:MAG: 3-hydroxyacyl-CoA dehydrogenase, partial [Alteraurantiacibacter sp.]